MEAKTTITQMLGGNEIIVPSYQRGYSWETEFEKNKMPEAKDFQGLKLSRLAIWSMFLFWAVK